MSKVLDAVREKYPQYADVGDDELTIRIGSKYPTYLDSDPEFKSEFAQAAGMRALDLAMQGNNTAISLLNTAAASMPTEAERKQAQERSGSIWTAALEHAEAFPGGPTVKETQNPEFMRGFSEGVKEGPGMAMRTISAPGKLAYFAAADAINAGAKAVEAAGGSNWSGYGGNLAHVLKEPESLVSGGTPAPAEAFISVAAKTNPHLAAAAKFGEAAAEMAPLGIIGVLPSTARALIAAGFSIDMIRKAPELFNAYADELSKAPGERNPDRLSDLESQVAQTLAFAPLAGAGALHGTAVSKASPTIPGIREAFKRLRDPALSDSLVKDAIQRKDEAARLAPAEPASAAPGQVGVGALWKSLTGEMEDINAQIKRKVAPLVTPRQPGSTQPAIPIQPQGAMPATLTPEQQRDELAARALEATKKVAPLTAAELEKQTAGINFLQEGTEDLSTRPVATPTLAVDTKGIENATGLTTTSKGGSSNVDDSKTTAGHIGEKTQGSSSQIADASEAARKTVLPVVGAGTAVRFVQTAGPFRDEVIVTRSAKQPGKWQATLLKDDGDGGPLIPSGDATFNTREEAIRSAMGETINGIPGAGSKTFVPIEKGLENAIPIRSAAETALETPPGNREAMGARVPESGETSLSQGEEGKGQAEVPPDVAVQDQAARVAPTVDVARAANERSQALYRKLQEAATSAYDRVGEGNEQLVNRIVSESELKDWAANDGAEDFAPPNLEQLVESAIAKINELKPSQPLTPPAVPEIPGVPPETVAKGVRVEAKDHPEVAAQHPEILPQLVSDELKLDKKAYDKDKDPAQEAPAAKSETSPERPPKNPIGLWLKPDENMNQFLKRATDDELAQAYKDGEAYYKWLKEEQDFRKKQKDDTWKDLNPILYDTDAFNGSVNWEVTRRASEKAAETPPAIPEGAKTEKEPWEMTKAEWETAPYESEYREIAKRIAKEEGVETAHDWQSNLGRLVEEKTAKEFFGRHPELNRNIWKQRKSKSAHKSYVREAISAGRVVPQEVLSDYPDLAKTKTAETKGVAKAEKQVEKVADTDGARSAKEVKDELVSRIESELAKLVEESKLEAVNDPEHKFRWEIRSQKKGSLIRDAWFDVEKVKSGYAADIHYGDGGYTNTHKVIGKTVDDVVQRAKEWVARGIGNVTIDIPGDGSFTIHRTGENLSNLLKRAKQIATKPTENRGGGGAVTSESETDKVISAYGSPEAAYRSTKRQRDALPDNDPDTPALVEKADLLLQELFGRTKAGIAETAADTARTSAATYRAGAETFVERIKQIEGLKRKTKAHLEKLDDLKARYAENQKRLAEFERTAKSKELEAERERAALEASPAAEPPKKPTAPPPSTTTEKGLTPAESTRLAELTSKVESGKPLTAAERTRYQALRDKATGTTAETKPEVESGPGTGAGPGTPSLAQGPDPRENIELLGEALQNIQGKKVPLGERMRQAVNVGKAATTVKDIVGQAVDELKAGAAKVRKAYEGVHNVDDMLRAKGELSAEIEKRGWRVRELFVKPVKKAIPDVRERAAIAKWVDAGGDMAELQRGYTEAPAQYKQAYLDAQNLSPDARVAAENIRNYFEARLDEAIDAGVLKGGVEDYIHRIYERDPRKMQTAANHLRSALLQPNPALAKKRVFQWDWEAEKLGYKPVQDFVDRVAAYETSLTKAIASREFIRKAMDMTAPDGRPVIDVKGIGIPVDDPSGVREATLIKPKFNPAANRNPTNPDGSPNLNYRDDYVERNYPALQKWKWSGTDSDGKPIFIQGQQAIHPSYAKRIDALLKPSAVRQIPALRTALGVSSVIKQTMLDFSMFHQVQIAIHGMEHKVWSIPTPPLIPGFKRIIKDIDFTNPDVEKLLRGGVTLGGEYYADRLGEGLVGQSISRAIPGIGSVLKVYHEWLFQRFIPRVKMTMALNALQRNRARYGRTMSDEQIAAKTAAEANSAFGELNYIMLERSQTARDVARLILLAPDFLEARGRFAGGALTKAGETKAPLLGGQEQRVALLLGALTLYTLARIGNKLSDDQYHFEPENLFSLVHDGHSYSLRTVQGDILHLLKSPLQFWMSRLNPVYGRTTLELATGRDYFGRKRDYWEQAVDAISTAIPISLRTGRERALWESVVNGLGVNARRWTGIDSAFTLAQKWNEKHGIKERGEFIYDPNKDPLRPLKIALSHGDEAASVGEIKRLLKGEGKLPDTYSTEGLRRKYLTDYFTRYGNMPFTGSMRNDRQFIASLSDDEKKTVEAARQYKVTIRDLFRKALATYDATPK